MPEGQWPRGVYPTSEVRGSGRECQAAMVQEWPRGATPRPRSGRQLRGATLRLRSGAATKRSYPVSKVGAAVKRSYPTSEVRGGGRECQASMVQERPRGATPRPRSGAVAESARLRWCRNGREELPHVRGKERQPRGATPCPRSGVAVERSYPTSEVRGGGRECQAATE